MTTYDRLCQILMDDFLVPGAHLKPKTVLADLGVDSLGMIELLCRVEHVFRIMTPTDQIRLSTIEDIVGFVDRLTGGHGTPVRAA